MSLKITTLIVIIFVAINFIINLLYFFNVYQWSRTLWAISILINNVPLLLFFITLYLKQK